MDDSPVQEAMIQIISMFLFLKLLSALHRVIWATTAVYFQQIDFHNEHHHRWRNGVQGWDRKYLVRRLQPNQTYEHFVNNCANIVLNAVQIKENECVCMCL